MFKDKLISLRKQNNMTQNDVAKLLHCSKGAVGKYERGEAEPSIDSLLKLSKFFYQMPIFYKNFIKSMEIL